VSSIEATINDHLQALLKLKPEETAPVLEQPPLKKLDFLFENRTELAAMKDRLRNNSFTQSYNLFDSTQYKDA
jgi:hypothetical protein